MRRALRWLFNLAAAVSLLLLATVCVLWARSSPPVQDYLVWRGPTTFMVESKVGRVWLQCWRGADPLPIRPEWSDLRWAFLGTTNPPHQPTAPIEVGYSPPTPRVSNGFGFRWLVSDFGTRKGPSVVSLQMLAVPHWSLAAAFAVVPAFWVLRRERVRRRLRKGLCPACRYDLRGSPSLTCPECGAERPKA